MTPVKLAVIGAGVIGKTHMEAMAGLETCRLVGIADPSPAAGALAARFGVACYRDHIAMLDELDPDGAVVATPNTSHVPIGLDCIERGIAVLVEKPIADSVEAALRLTHAAEAAKVPLLVGHHRRHNPILRRAKQVIDDGLLGCLISATVLYTFLKPDDYFNLTWRREEGGGPILINLIHEIDTLRHLFGEIASLQAAQANCARGFAVEDTAATVLTFRNGALATISLSDAVVAPWSWDMTTGESPQFARKNVITHYLSGTEGSLTVPNLEYWRYDGGRGWLEPLTRTELPLKPANPYVAQLQHFCQVVRGEVTPLVSGTDAARTLEATLAVRQAADSARPVVFL